MDENLQKLFHDINNKLSGISGYCSIMVDDKNITNEQKRRLGIVIDLTIVIDKAIRDYQS